MLEAESRLAIKSKLPSVRVTCGLAAVATRDADEVLDLGAGAPHADVAKRTSAPVTVALLCQPTVNL